jgi:hypothetical protein
MGPPGVASGLLVARPLYWRHELPVSVIEIREILRLWLQGRGLREVARLSGTDRKTVRRYVDRARSCGVDRDGDACQLTDELLAAVIAGVRPSRPNGKIQAWKTIASQHDQIKAWLEQDLTLTKVHTGRTTYEGQKPRLGDGPAI